MGNSIWDNMRQFIGKTGFKIFLWAYDMTQEQYWESIYEQEKPNKAKKKGLEVSLRIERIQDDDNLLFTATVLSGGLKTNINQWLNQDELLLLVNCNRYRFFERAFDHCKKALLEAINENYEILGGDNE